MKSSDGKRLCFAVPTDSNFNKISQEIHIPSSFSKNIVRKGESNYNDKEFYYIGQTFRHDDKSYIAIASAKPLCGILPRIPEENIDHLYCAFVVFQHDFSFIYLKHCLNRS